MNPLGELASSLYGTATSRKTWAALVLGLIAGSNQVVSKVALASVVFAGALAPYSGQGTRIVLLGNAVVCLFIALGSGFRGAVGTSPPALLIVVAGIGAALTLQGDVLFATMIAIIAIGSLATGLCAMLLGSFRLANLIRFVPYPLACGFVAGIGALCFKIAFRSMGVTLDSLNPESVLEPLAVANWGLGIAYGLGIFLATRRFKSLLILPGSFAAATALFYLTLALLDISIAEAETAGLLLAGMSESAAGGFWPLFDPAVLGQVDWSAVVTQVPNLLALVLMTFLCLVIYLGAFELAGNLELDWNREFKVVGLASMAAGAGGAPPGCLTVSPSLRNLMFGADTRLAGIFVALFVAIVAISGNAVIRLVPAPLVGGVLLFTGATLLETWLVGVRRKLAWPEFAIVLLIFLTILFFGFLVGVGVGALVLVIFLLTRLAAVDPVESRFTAREHRSNRIRPIPERAILRMQGERVQVYKLRGYIFFGTAHALADRLKQSLSSDPQPVCILLDFGAVTGCDVSAVNALSRFILAAESNGSHIALTGTSKEFDFGLRRNLPSSVHDRLLLTSDADKALERCEDLVLEAYTRVSGDDAAGVDSQLLQRVADDLTTYLDRQILFEDLVSELDPWLEPIEYRAGETIASYGEKTRGMLLLTIGRVALFDSSGTRLAERQPGDVIGPGADLGGRSARFEVRATEPCKASMLTPEAARWLEKNEPTLMLKLYRYLVGQAPTATREPTA